MQWLKTLLALILCSGAVIAHATVTGKVTRTNFSNSQNELYGYVCDSSVPTKIYSVSFYQGATLLGSVTASVQGDNSVSSVCSGNAYHSFVYVLPESLRDGIAHSLTVTALPVGGGVSITLAGSPMSVTLPASQPLRGYFAFINTDFMWGWACNPAITADSYPAIQVVFYTESGINLGSITPSIYADSGVGGVCTSRYRSFQFPFPSVVKDSGNHTIYAYVQDGNGRFLLSNTPQSHLFTPRVYSIIATQPNATSANINAILSTSAPGDGTFIVGPYCFLGNQTGTHLTWSVGSYTGFVPSSPVADWQRGATNTPNVAVAVQAQGMNAGIYVNNASPYVEPNCAGLAGANAIFVWNTISAAPAIWPTDNPAGKSRELIIGFDMTVPTATGVSYGGPSILFRDKRNDKIIHFNIQAFDTRNNGAVKGTIGSCTPTACSSPMFYTSYGLGGIYLSWGRTITGNFRHTPYTTTSHYEYRISGYNLENAVAMVGCSDTNINMLSCKGSDYRFSIVQVGIENVIGSIIGAKISNIQIGYTYN